MSKVISDSLFKLVNSLSKSEKRSFKLFAGRSGKKQKKILTLFNAMERQKNYDEKKILSRERSLSRVQLPNLKAHLYTQVMKSLSVSPTPQIPELGITSLLDSARILYSKCLYADSLRLLAKAREAALQHESKFLLLEILEMKKRVLRHADTERSDTHVQALLNEASQTASGIQNINRFSNLALRLASLYQHTGFIRNRSEYQKAQRYLKSLLPSYEEIKLSLQEKLHLYSALTGFHYFTQDFKSGHALAKKWVDLFDTHPGLANSKGEQYIRALNTLLAAQHKLGLLSEFTLTHKKLIALKREPLFLKNENINLNLFKSIYLHEINRHFLTGEFSAGTRIVRKLEGELQRFLPRLDRHTVLIFYYKISCLYFGAGNFRMAVRWLSRIIHEKEDALREDIHSFARILRLISHFELGDREQVEYSIRSTYRFLLKKGTLQRYELYILNFLKDSRDYTTERKLQAAFLSLKQKMEQLNRSRYEKRGFLYFDILSWLESRIQNRPVEKIIQEKSQKRQDAPEK